MQQQPVPTTTAIDVTEVTASFATGIKAPTLRRVDGRGQRFYYDATNNDFGEPVITVVPSVTSILDATMTTPDHIVKWTAEMGYYEARQYMKEKAEYGTLMHILCAMFMQGEPVDLDTVAAFIDNYVAQKNITFYTAHWKYELQRDMLAFAAWANKVELKVLAIEIPLMSLRLGYAGTIDIVAELTFNRKRVIAIVDMKSGRVSKWEASEIQLVAYKYLWEDNFPNMPIQMLFNWSPKDWRKEPTFDFTNQTETDAGLKWPYLLELYRINDEVKPKPFVYCHGTIQLGRDVTSNFEIVAIEEHLTRLHSAKNNNNVVDAANVKTF